MPTPFEDAAARLVARWQVASKHTTSYVLSLGQAAHVAIGAKLKGVQDPGARKTARADAIRALRAALEDAGCDRATELVRWVGCWAVGEVFGMEQAKLLSLATVRAFIPLVRRNAKTETWAARSTFRDFAKEVWSTAATMKAKEVTAAIRAKVGATRKPRTVKAPDPAAAMTKVVKSIEALPVEAQRQLLHALQRRFQPSPAAVPTVPVEAQRQPVAPQHVAGRIDQAPETKAGIFGSWGRKAG